MRCRTFSTGYLTSLLRKERRDIRWSRQRVAAILRYEGRFLGIIRIHQSKNAGTWLRGAADGKLS